MTKTAQAVALAAALLLAAGTLPAAPQNQRPAGAAASATRSSGKNALVEEMTSLDNVIREVVSAIAQGDGARVAKAIDSLSGPTDKTQQANKAGTISLPKNGDRVDDFQRRYESYHAQLTALSRAGQQNDIEAMLMITKQLLEGCVSCHRTFKK